MRIIALDGLGHPIVLHATRILVQLDTGTPIMAAVEEAGGEVLCNHVNDGPAFQRLLREFGIHQTVVVERIRVPTLDDFKI